DAEARARLRAGRFYADPHNGKHHEIKVRYGRARKQVGIQSARLSPASAVRKKVTRRSRRSKARSRQSVRQIRNFERGVAMSAQPSLVAAVPQRRGVGSWQETTDLEKVVFGVRAVEALGGSNGYAFTLNLGPDVELRAHSDRSGSSGASWPISSALGP